MTLIQFVELVNSQGKFIGHMGVSRENVFILLFLYIAFEDSAI